MGASLGEQLLVCQAAELIRQVQAEPELEYWFKHALVQEAAYESLLKARRAELHGRVAAAIEQSPGGRSEANAAVLALHYESAGQDAKALPYAVMAGNRARRTYAHQEALTYYDKALAMAERLNDPEHGPIVRSVYINRGIVFEVVNDYPRASENYRAMAALAERAGDVAMQADAMNRLATVQAVIESSEPDLLASLQAALALARRSGEPALVGRALWNIGLYYRFKEPRRAIETLQKGLELVQSADPDDVALAELAGNIQLDLSVAMWITGRFRQVRAYGERAIAAFRALNVPQMLADALGGMSTTLYYMGDVAGAVVAADESLRISRTIGNSWGIVYSQWGRLAVELDRGDFEALLAGHEERMSHARNAGFPVLVGLSSMLLALARLELGQLELAQAATDEAVRAFERMDGQVWHTFSCGVASRPLIRRGELDPARRMLAPLWRPGDDPVDDFEGFFMAAPVIAELALLEKELDFGLGFCTWFVTRLEAEEVWRLAAEMRYWRGRIALARGDPAAAQADLLEARARLAASEVHVLLWKVDAVLADLYRALGYGEAAESAQAQAAAGVQRLAGGIRDDALRRSFLGRLDVRSVLDSAGR